MSHEDARRWPAPRSGQARLTLLGSHHLATPGNDEHELDVDDTLAPDRQAELADLRERLGARDFDHVAVEIPRDHQSDLDEQFAAVDDAFAFEDPDALPAGPARMRGEAVQVGFRLAAALGHDRVHAVDSRPDAPDLDADWAIAADPEDVPYPLPDVAELVAEAEATLRSSTIPDALRELNREAALQAHQTGNVAACLDSSDDHDYVGARQLGVWYERNARLLENLRRVTGPDEATLFVVGASHVVPVRQLAAAAPATCPRSPVALLTD